jgi:hypothetical protein
VLQETIAGSPRTAKRLGVAQHPPKKGCPPNLELKRIRDLYYTSDIHASVQQCRLLVRERIARLRARPFTPFLLHFRLPSDYSREQSTRNNSPRGYLQVESAYKGPIKGLKQEPLYSS